MHIYVNTKWRRHKFVKRVKNCADVKNEGTEKEKFNEGENKIFICFMADEGFLLIFEEKRNMKMKCQRWSGNSKKFACLWVRLKLKIMMRVSWLCFGNDMWNLAWFDLFRCF